MIVRHRAILLMSLFAILWAAVDATAAGVMSRYSAYQIVWTRYGVHLLLMLLVCGWRDPASLVRTSRPGLQISRSLMMLIMPASWITARQSGIPAEAVLSLFWLSPLLITGLATVVLHERVPATLWVAAAIASGGAGLLFHGELPRDPWHVLLPLAMAGSFSVYVVMTRVLRSETTRANLFYTAAGVFIPLSAFMPAVWVLPGLADFGEMAAVGALGWLALYALDGAAAAAPLASSVPFLGFQLISETVLETLWSRDLPGRATMAGLAAIVMAAALGLWAANAKATAPERTRAVQG